MVLDDLAGTLPTSALLTDPDVLESYRRDQAAIVEAGVPLAAVRPGSTAQVQEVLRIASRHRVPVVPRGAGSGLSGGANAVDG
ncbi:MAG TPA: FAD-binding protein, partial [Actinomycetota bacterium]|nr:FAD-binding protein [Actinomycetota bacterium]